MIIKVLFAIFVLSAAALVSAAIAVFVRVHRQLKPRGAQTQGFAEAPHENNTEGSL